MDKTVIGLFQSQTQVNILRDELEMKVYPPTAYRLSENEQKWKT